MSEMLGRSMPSPTAVRQIERICDRFEAAWKAGLRPHLSEYLGQASESVRAPLLRELLPLDWEYRARAGDRPQAADYRARFPDLDTLIETLGCEIEAIVAAGPTVRKVGEYRIVRQAGRGGMGVVYEAVHEPSGRRVALKMLGIDLADPTARERFRREARTTARLRHPNIVRIFEVGESDGKPFLVLELVSGSSLDHRLRQGPLPPEQAASLVRTLARAVHHAHERGIVHRDLKPANVLLSRVRSEPAPKAEFEGDSRDSPTEYTPKITDFGLAHHVEGRDLTATGDIVGTPGYMAPEQARGKSQRLRIGPPADVYALGAILYAAVTARPPFRGATVQDSLEKVRTREPVPPTRLRPQVPRDLETICLYCLEKDPGNRYPDAEALADDLDRFLAGEPITARRAGPAKRLGRWCRRNPAPAAAGILGVVALMATVGLAVNHTFTVRLRHEQRLTKSALKDVEFQRAQAVGNAERLARQEKLTRAALTEAERFRRQAERLSASFALERGLTLLEQGDLARGMLLLGHGLQIAPAGSADLQHVIRSNLAAADRQLPYALEAVIEHGGEVRAVAFSPDGRMLLTGGRVGAPRRWDAMTGEPIADPLSHAGEIRAVAFNANGALIATAGTDKTARLWETTSGIPVGKPLSHAHWVQAVAFSPDGRTVVTGSADGTAQVWETATGEPRGRLLPPGWIHAVAFSPDGRILATAGSAHSAQLWDAATLKPIGMPMVHQGEVWTVAFSPDGRVLLTGSEAGTALLWEADTGKPLGVSLLHQGPIRNVGYSADGKVLWTAGANGKVRLWDAARLTPLGAPVLHQSAVYAVALSPDRSRLATGCADGKVRLWKTPAPAASDVLLPHERLVYCLAISPDGKTIATGSADPDLRLWDTATGKRVGKSLTHQASILRVVFSQDGKTLLTACSDRTARLWDVAAGTPCGPVLHHADHVYAVAFSPDGKTILTGCKDSTARLWDAATGKPLVEPLRHPGWVHAVAFSPDGKTIATGCEDSTVRFWDSATGTSLGEPLPHRGPVRAVAFGPDGHLLLTGTWDDGTARLWDVTTRKPFGPPLPHQEHVLAVAFSPDGKTVATGAWDGTAHLWDVATGKPLGPAFVHQRSVRDVAFSPEGKTLWTAGFDRTVRSWERPVAVPGEVNRIILRIQVLTGMELDSEGLFRELDASAWLQRRRLLDQVGGPI